MAQPGPDRSEWRRAGPGAEREREMVRGRDRDPGPAHHHWPMMVRPGDQAPAFNYSHQISGAHTRASQHLAIINSGENDKTISAYVWVCLNCASFWWIKSNFYDEWLALVDRQQQPGLHWAQPGLAQLRWFDDSWCSDYNIGLHCTNTVHTGKNCISRPLALSLSLVSHLRQLLR